MTFSPGGKNFAFLLACQILFHELTVTKIGRSLIGMLNFLGYGLDGIRLPIEAGYVNLNAGKIDKVVWTFRNKIANSWKMNTNAAWLENVGSRGISWMVCDSDGSLSALVRNSSMPNDL
uniref:Uncharacterized protein n=1 Tax=Cucumis sativus TaxID=3659 RepID=A0A0A0KLV3_CUCSA